MRLHTVIQALFFGLVLLGCDSAGEAPPVLMGRYEGTFTYIAEPGPFFPGGPVSQLWTVSLTETGRGVVTGTGSLGTTSITVSGTHDHPDVTLEFTDAGGSFAGRLTGTLSDDGGVLDGSYSFNLFFVNIAVMLSRQ